MIKILFVCHGNICRSTMADYGRFDYIIGMDEANRRNLLRMLKNDPEGKVSLLLDYTLQPGGVGESGSPWNPQTAGQRRDFGGWKDSAADGAQRL